jgi:hypothetical protein
MYHRTATSSGARSFACGAQIDELEPDFRTLVDRTMKSVRSGIPKPDKVFGDFSPIVSLARSVAYHEGKLLELGIARIVACNPDLVLLPTDRSMPIVPAAVELLKRNDWSSLKGIRLPSEVHASETYTPDLLIAHKRRHSGLIIDVKRSLASYVETRLEALRFRMMAVAAIASSWLAERQGPVLVEVSTAIIDGSDEISDHDKGVFSLSEIDALLEIDGAGAAMTHLRSIFARRVRTELMKQCQLVVGSTADGIGLVVPQIGKSPDLDGEAADPQPDASNSKLLPLRQHHDVRIGFARPRTVH